MAENKTVDPRLKKFMQDNFDFAGLKKAGVFQGIDKSDYEKQAERICKFFSYKSVYEYGAHKPEIYEGDNFINGKFPDKINGKGEYKPGGGFHLSLAAKDFDIACCICGCEQSVSVSTSTWHANKTCKGCKRKISISVSIGIAEVKER